MSHDIGNSRDSAHAEEPIASVRGTRDWLPLDYSRLARLETLILDRFTLAGYEPMRTPVLEFCELHERKSGAAIVAKLYELANDYQSHSRLCLRPELTASIVRAYAAAEPPPDLPWRVSMSGPVFRYETLANEPQEAGENYREFQQVGVELLGASGPSADAELIWLADSTLTAAGLTNATIRVGHVGTILEVFERSGLPLSLRSSLVEMLSDAAASGMNVAALETGLARLADWLDTPELEKDRTHNISFTSTCEDARLLRSLVPKIAGRRSAEEILERIQRKWNLSKTLGGSIEDLRGRLRVLAGIHGPARGVLDRLESGFASSLPVSVGELRGLVEALEAHGVDPDRIEVDLGFGRGIGFYTHMVFEIVAATPGGTVEVCGGGRYDGLATVLGGGRDPRGAGFAIGLERFAAVLEAQSEDRARDQATDPAPASAYVVAAAPHLINQAIATARDLRGRGVRAILGHEANPDAESAAVKAARLGLARALVVRRADGDPTAVEDRPAKKI